MVLALKSLHWEGRKHVNNYKKVKYKVLSDNSFHKITITVIVATKATFTGEH